MTPYFLTIIVYFVNADPLINHLQFNSLNKCLEYAQEVGKDKILGCK